MKKLIILLGFLLASSLSYSQLLEENFNYPVGDSLGAHGWVSFSGGSTNVLSVTAPGLTYPGYPLSGIGNATTLMSSGQDAYKDLSSSDSTGAIYVSFMVNVTSAQSLATGNYFFAFLPSTSTSFYSARFYASDSAGLRFGLSKVASSVGPIVYTTDTYALNTTYLVVLKYQFNPGSEDAECSAYIFESGFPSTEPSTPTIGPVTGTSPDISIGRIALRQGTASSSPLTQVDGILVSKSWLNNLNYPIANFTANNTVINAGGSVNFTNTSTNNPTVFNWFFPGGSPYTTTAENPSNIIYNTPGVYTVYLRVANAAGADSITKTNYITVNPLPCTPTWSNFLKISDAGNIKDSLKFGTSPTATIGIDPCFGETPQPPVA